VIQKAIQATLQDDTKQRRNICLINIAGKAHNGHKVERILNTIKHLPADTEYLYFPMDLRHDRSGAEQLKYVLPALKIQDRSGSDITQIVKLFRQAQRAIGDRLHFGILAQQCGCDLTLLSSSEKMRKFFDKNREKSILEYEISSQNLIP
jgi:exopolysaccharide biosynthesis predicted pyruvyltransferase EpsI